MEQEEWIKQTKALIDDIGASGQSTYQQTKVMFLLYNERLTPRETGQGCPPCVVRVWKSLQREYNRLIAE